MKYMIRDVFTCKRGKVPEYLELLKIVVGYMRSIGITEQKVYADIAESMDTIFHEMEVDSLDEYFNMERGFFVDMPNCLHDWRRRVQYEYSRTSNFFQL